MSVYITYSIYILYICSINISNIIDWLSIFIWQEHWAVSMLLFPLPQKNKQSYLYIHQIYVIQYILYSCIAPRAIYCEIWTSRMYITGHITLMKSDPSPFSLYISFLCAALMLYTYLLFPVVAEQQRETKRRAQQHIIYTLFQIVIFCRLFLARWTELMPSESRGFIESNVFPLYVAQHAYRFSAISM